MPETDYNPRGLVSLREAFSCSGARGSEKGVSAQLQTHRRHLPHWQLGGSVYFVTFRCLRGALPVAARRQATLHILYDHQRRFDLHLAVVMPDHVHLLLKPLEKQSGTWYSLSEILKGLKGASARRINQLLGTMGAVWQDESYDRIVRDEEEFVEKFEYIYNNPVRAGLVRNAEDYEFLVFPPDR